MTRRLLAVLLAAGALAGCGGDGDGTASGDGRAAAGAATAGAPADQHIHGLAVDPDDGALLIATHAGLFRAEAGAAEAARISRERQDLMGFAIAPGGEYVASGHPAGDGSAALGYLRSSDEGRSFRPVSLEGEADFHVLRLAGRRVYGAVPGSPLLMVSDDDGRTWTERRAPGEVFDIVVHPERPAEILAATESGLARSTDTGGSWRYQSVDVTGLAAWPERGRLLVVDGAGTLRTSRDAGLTWQDAGSVDGPPVAITADREAIHVALADGTVKRSEDGGRTWTVRLSLS